VVADEHRRSIHPDYQVFLRSYDGDGLQSVVYAVPSNRRLSNQENQTV
jgi:hypothetical protein